MTKPENVLWRALNVPDVSYLKSIIILCGGSNICNDSPFDIVQCLVSIGSCFESCWPRFKICISRVLHRDDCYSFDRAHSKKKKFNSEMFRGLQRLKLGMLSKFWSAKGGEVLENPLEKDFCFNLRLNFRRQRILTYVLRNHTDIRQTTNFTKNNLDSFKKQPNHLLFQVTLTRHNFNHAKQLLKSSFL